MGSFSSAPIIKRVVLQPYNSVLKTTTVTEVETSPSPTPVVMSFIYQQTLFAVTTQQVAAYDLVQGEAQPAKYVVHPNTYVTEAVRPSLDLLALCCKNGEIQLLSVPDLSVVMSYSGPTSRLITGAGAPPESFKLALTARQDSRRELDTGGVFFVGYESGEVCKFSYHRAISSLPPIPQEPPDVTQASPEFTYSPLREPSGSAVAFAFSTRWSLMFVGCTASKSSVLIYSPQNSQCLRELQGLSGSVLDLAVYDSRNQVIGLGSVNSSICVWDFMTSYLLLDLRYPTLLQGVFPTRFKLLVNEATQLMLVGLSEGSLTLNSYIYDADNSDYRLIPYKIITSPSSEVVSAVDYDSVHDITLVGDCRSCVFVYNHLESAPVEQSEAAALSSKEKPRQSKTSLRGWRGDSSGGEQELAELQPKSAPGQSSSSGAH
jgi:hypothetical protein